MFSEREFWKEMSVWVEMGLLGEIKVLNGFWIELRGYLGQKWGC